MHARTRTLAEALPHLVATARSRRGHARLLLTAAHAAEPDTVLTIDGVSYQRVANRTIKSIRILVQALTDDSDRPV